MSFTGSWQTIEFNMVPSKYFQQLLKCLDDPQPHSVKTTQHWRAPILTSSATKVTYRFFELDRVKTALEKQDTVSLKKQVLWSGDKEVTDSLLQIDPRDALIAARRKARGETPRDKITCRSHMVVGYGEGRATRELDLIWWPDLYRSVSLGKLCIRIYVSRVEMF